MYSITPSLYAWISESYILNVIEISASQRTRIVIMTCAYRLLGKGGPSDKDVGY